MRGVVDTVMTGVMVLAAILIIVGAMAGAVGWGSPTARQALERAPGATGTVIRLEEPTRAAGPTGPAIPSPAVVDLGSAMVAPPGAGRDPVVREVPAMAPTPAAPPARRRGVVVGVLPARLQVREAPALTAPVVGHLAEGETADIVGWVGDHWLQIRYPASAAGVAYVWGDYLIELAEAPRGPASTGGLS